MPPVSPKIEIYHRVQGDQVVDFWGGGFDVRNGVPKLID